MPVSLRDYQQTLVSHARDAYASGAKSVLLQAPTGAGKTVIAAHILASAVRRGQTVWMLVHRRELLDQVCEAIRREACGYWVASAGWQRLTDETPGSGVMVGSIGTVARRTKSNRILSLSDTPTLCVWDECHHLAARTWATTFGAFPSCRHLGLTATPIRGDGSGLGKFFERMVTGPQTRDLITLGALAPYRMLAPSTVDLNGVHLRAGEYIASESARAVGQITGDVVAHYQRHAAGRQALVFCVSREHSRDVVAAFNAAGIGASHVDGETPTPERQACVADFRAGRLNVLSNVDLFGEGVDLPAVDVLIMLRPTMSLPLYLQQVGRVLRAAPGKTALILDHVGNVERHGLPDALRRWELETDADKSKQKEKIFRVWTCANCFSAQSIARKCRYCGAVRPVNGARTIEERDGELVEVPVVPPTPTYTAERLRQIYMWKGMAPRMAEALARKRATA